MGGWYVGLVGSVHVNVSYALGLNTPFQTLGLPLAGGYVDFRLIPSVHCLGPRLPIFGLAMNFHYSGQTRKKLPVGVKYPGCCARVCDWLT